MANSGSFKKGDGRQRKPKGAINKVTGLLKDMILQSLSNVGGTTYLESQAKANPSAYMALIGRVLPLQVKEGGDDPRVPPTVVNHIYEEAPGTNTPGAHQAAPPRR